MHPEEPRRLGLALGGGGGRGSAHIGVLSELERLTVPVDLIAGTSVGALVGTLYAAGFTPDVIEGLFRAATVRRVVARDPSNYGLIGTAKIEAWLRELLGERTFADLRLPLAMVAVDLLTGDEVILNEGSLVEALLATIAVPGVFPPRPRGAQLLADGMLRNNLPVDVAQRMGAGRVIAVDLHTFQRSHSFSKGAQPGRWSPRRWVTLSQFAVLDRSLDIMMSEITHRRLRECPPDLLLTPEMSGLTPFELTRATEGRAAGAAVAHAHAAEIAVLRSWRLAPPLPALPEYYPRTGPSPDGHDHLV